MASRFASTILTRANSMKHSKLPGLRKSIQTTFTNDGGGYETNEYIHKNFFDGENYQSILKCLDDGYEISTDLIEYMQDYCNILRDLIQNLTSYSSKWKSKIKRQSTLSSYNTTKQAQIQTVSSPIKLAQLIQTRCDAIEQVINSFKRQVDRMYPGERFGTVHKHYRTDVMKKLFKNAYSSLSKVSDIRDELREQEKKGKQSLLEAQIECQNLGLDETTSKSKLSKANTRLEKRENELKDIQDKLARAEDDYNQEQKAYRQKATDIYQQCRDLEKERLDLIRATLISYNQAIHSSEYSTEQDAIYVKLLSKIESEQCTVTDLDFWAQTYRVDTLTRSISSETNESDENENNKSQTTTRKTKKSQKNDTDNLTTIEENTNQSVVETQEDQIVSDKSTTAAKTKQKKKKNNTTDPTTPEISQT